jgi:hypothetical protein
VSEALQYRLIDEPRPSALSKLALPPLLAFMVATFFQPWGYFLIVFNAIALNGPQRNQEIGYALAPLLVYYGALETLDRAVRSGTLTINQAHYLFVVAIGLGLASAAFAFISQARTFELRRYLNQLGGYAA